MTQKPAAKEEQTLESLEATAITLAKHENRLTADIDKLTEERTKLRKERRAIEGKITTININSQVF
jgi:predicted  nucleic acid-binding Zn-ribbon protein